MSKEKPEKKKPVKPKQTGPATKIKKGTKARLEVGIVDNGEIYFNTFGPRVNLIESIAKAMDHNVKFFDLISGAMQGFMLIQQERKKAEKLERKKTRKQRNTEKSTKKKSKPKK